MWNYSVSALSGIEVAYIEELDILKLKYTSATI
jgi:hypothetical protein